MNSAPIGMFDSGVGGIGTLREVVRAMPNERFIFFGDTANAPYGVKPREKVQELSINIVENMKKRGVKAVVIACNTATSASEAELLKRYDFPIIGIEPALEAAQKVRSKDGVILSIATPGTIAGERYQKLARKFGEGVHSIPCPGLMEFVERCEFDSPALQAYFDERFAPYAGEKVDAITLGCTHYVFLKKALHKRYPDAALLEGNGKVIERLRQALIERDALAPDDQEGSVELNSSGGEEAIRLMKILLEQED